MQSAPLFPHFTLSTHPRLRRRRRPLLVRHYHPLDFCHHCRCCCYCPHPLSSSLRPRRLLRFQCQRIFNLPPASLVPHLLLVGPPIIASSSIPPYRRRNRSFPFRYYTLSLYTVATDLILCATLWLLFFQEQRSILPRFHTRCPLRHTLASVRC